jgi:ubiquinone/menaquinone biosynthesis C-methylase UbiE
MPLWDVSARQYDAFEKKWHHYEKIATGLIELLEIREDSNLLELASGTGACSKLLGVISKNGTTTGIDSSVEMVRIAKENIAESGLSNVSFVARDVSEIGNIFPKGQFDIVVCNSAFWQFPDPSKVSIDVHSLLRIGGQFSFNIPQWFPSDEEESFSEKSARDLCEPRTLRS